MARLALSIGAQNVRVFGVFRGGQRNLGEELDPHSPLDTRPVFPLKSHPDSFDTNNMKELVSSPPPIVRNDVAAVQALFQQNVIPSYGRFDLVLSHGSGAYLYDVAGKRYLDLGGGIAVNCLGHAHPALTEALTEQSRKLIHVSNYYYHEPQGRLAMALVNLIAPGK
jgi:4-aminobutyrate aminotransferase-like enzyme